MANYERYTPEFQASDGRIYGVKDKDAREEIASLNSALNEKADKIGSSPDLIAGTAEQLLSSDVVEDAVPYLYRKSGGGLDIGNREKIEKIVGGTVAWNQLEKRDRPNNTVAGITFTQNEDGSITLNGTATGNSNVMPSISGTAIQSVNGHVYLAVTNIQNPSNNTLTVGIYNDQLVKLAGESNCTMYKSLVTGTVIQIGYRFASGTVLNNVKISGSLFDLTQMFGSTIADYIYNLEQANAGAGVAWFKKLFPKDYYSYNPGELISVKTTSHNMVGFNAWDEEWEVGYINSTTGAQQNASDAIRSKNYIPAIGGETYHISTAYTAANQRPYLHWYDADKKWIGCGYSSSGQNYYTATIPNNAKYLKFTVANISTPVTYNHDICINLSHSGSRNGEYEPYEKHSYPLDSSLTLRGIPKLDANNKLYYDGDSYAGDGTVTRRYGVVDLGTLNWEYVDSAFFRSTAVDGAVAVTSGNPNVLLSKNYLLHVGASAGFNAGDKLVWAFPTNVSSVPRFAIKDSSYTDAATFKTAMSGVYAVYELGAPTTETAEPYTEIQNVDPYGTEEFVSESIVPVGHSTKYPANLVKKLEGLPWDFSTLIAPTESTTTASRPYAVGSYLILNNTLYKVTSAIANGGTITPGTNVTATTIMAELAALA